VGTGKIALVPTDSREKLVTGLSNATAVRRSVAGALAVLVVSAVGGILGASPATAARSDAAAETTSIDPVIVLTQNGVPVEEFQLSGATTAQVVAAADLISGLPHGGVNEVGAQAPVRATQATVGLGTSIYVYFNRKDYDTIMAAGAAGAASLICAPGGALAVALCNTVANLAANSLSGKVPPAGYCAEVKLSYPIGVVAPTIQGVKMVKRSC
jgi:hypothetical protein